MRFNRRFSHAGRERLAWVSLVVSSALLLVIGLVLSLAQPQVLAHPAVSASEANLTVPTAVITSQIRSPNRDAYITKRGSMTISGIAWREGTDPPYLTDDPQVSLQRIDENSYYVQWTSVVSASDYLLQEATDPSFDVEAITFSEWIAGTNRPFDKLGDTGTYYYRVQAAAPDVDNPSRWSNVVSVTIPWAEASMTTASPEIAANGPVTVQVRIGEPDQIEGKSWDTTSTAAQNWGGWQWSYEWELPEKESTLYLIQSRASEEGNGFGPKDTITVTLDNQVYFMYFPVTVKRWPPIPYGPDLREIENQNNWVNYTLNWSYSDPGDAVPDPDTYTIQEARSPDFSGPTTYSVPGSQTSLAITDEEREKQNGTYYYRVRGNNRYGPGEWSNVRATTLRVVPYAPSLNAIDNPDEEDAYTVSWTYDHAYPPVDSYVLQEAEDASFTVAVREHTVSGQTSKAFTDRSSGTYYYRVRAHNAYATGTWSNVRSTTVETLFPYFDDFSDMNSGWPSVVDDERWAFYEVDPSPPLPGDGSPYPHSGNAYFIARRSGGEPLAKFSPGVAVPSNNYQIEVDTRWWDARWYATYQILFGADESLSHYYAVRVQINDIRNLCRFSIVKHWPGGTWVLNETWQDLPMMDCRQRRDAPDTAWNHWKIRREGDRIRIHVNGTFLGEWRDASFGANRYFGVRATLYEGFTPSKPEYDNFSVEILD